MSKQNQERRGCRECGEIDMHEQHCPLTHRYDFRTPVIEADRDSERSLPTQDSASSPHVPRTVTSSAGTVSAAVRSPERHGYINQGSGRCAKVLAGGWPCRQFRDAEIHQVAPQPDGWLRLPCGHSSEWTRGTGKCQFPSCDEPQPPPEAACGDHCSHDPRLMDSETRTCSASVYGGMCLHKCPAPEAEAAPKSLTLEEYQADIRGKSQENF